VKRRNQIVTRYMQDFHFQGQFFFFLCQCLATIRHQLITVIRMLRTVIAYLAPPSRELIQI
jgi:hypothetical protein